MTLGKLELGLLRPRTFLSIVRHHLGAPDAGIWGQNQKVSDPSVMRRHSACWDCGSFIISFIIEIFTEMINPHALVGNGRVR